MQLECSRHIFENISNFMKIRQEGTEFFLMGTDSQTGMIKLISASRNFANVPKKECSVVGFRKLAVRLSTRTRAACMPMLLVTPQVCRALIMREASVHICEHLPYMTLDCYWLPLLLVLWILLQSDFVSMPQICRRRISEIYTVQCKISASCRQTNNEI
jgi:hypothetical protein